MEQKKLVIIGNGMVGQEYIQKLISLDTDQLWSIEVFSKEPYQAYDRVALSSYFEDFDHKKLYLQDKGYYEENSVTLHLGDPIITINRESQQVSSHKGLTVDYDALIFSTGSSAFVPPIKDINSTGVFVYRNIEDLLAIKEYAQGKTVGAVIGGGLLGLECAKAIKTLGLEAHIIERAPHLMPAQLDLAGGETLETQLTDMGYIVHTSASTEHVILDNGKVSGVKLGADESLPCDILVVSAGIVPNDQLAKECGIQVDDRAGIVIDEFCRTSDPKIFAIGECANFQKNVYGLVAPGYQMAEIAVKQLLGIENSAFSHQEIPTKLKLAGVDVASIGNKTYNNADVDIVSFIDRRNNTNIYKKLAVNKETGKLINAIFVGDVDGYDALLTFSQNNLALPESYKSFIIPTDNAAAAPVFEIPNDAIVCSCKSLNKQQVCQTINEHQIVDVGTLKDISSAGTGCAGCVPTLKKLINEEIEKNGWEKNKAVCEHFAYTRQELFDLVKLKKYKNFNEAIENLGSGSGCEVCRPLISSVLATTTTGLVVEKQHMPAQDFNDRYLANIQRDGTYSIIPRIPGGETTAKDLITLGEIAKEFGLYVRFTGGQRISFFGAKIEALPMIWQRLVESGFESGHAYGKALRTVKTCVGDTWCPWGVQDSTNLAIKLEQRYRGLRSPHKTKSGVSGCVRDCAEAKVKDFGLVATEKGWNLLVAGNGGRDNQFGVLLAEDITDEEVIRYTDRFLMYYIRTADHLARTATWLNNIEGGIDHVRNVVINDSLGICEELEAEMAEHVDNYYCEWKKALNSNEVMERYQHYGNSEETDDNIIFVPERGQIRPAKPAEKSGLIASDANKGLSKEWFKVGESDSILPGTGINTLVNGRDVAIVKLSGSNQLFAIDNLDPFSQASVLSRGIVGDRKNEPMIISPISRKAFSLISGQCFEDRETSLNVYPVKQDGGSIFVQPTPFSMNWISQLLDNLNSKSEEAINEKELEEVS